MPRQRPETRERVRRNIEEAALRILAEQGYDATGMRDVAREAGMSPASLYNHYDGKEELFSALVARYRGNVLDEDEDNPLRDYMKGCEFPADIPQLAEALEAVVVRDKQYLHLWYIDLVHFGGRHFRNELAPTLLLERPELKARLKQLEQDGVLRQDPTTAFKIVYVHLFNFFLVLHVFDNGKFFGGDAAKSKYLDGLNDMFLNGMLAERQPAAAPKTPSSGKKKSATATKKPPSAARAGSRRKTR
jgi:AcrR family transcriptional regulator